MYCTHVFTTLFILTFSQRCASTPFLYNPSSLPALISSASAPNPSVNSNIADLRMKKLERLQEEKEGPVEEEDVKVVEDNEAAPTLLQKKIGKILAKLRFIAQFSRFGNNEPSQEEDDFDKEFNDEGTSKNRTIIFTQTANEANETAKLTQTADEVEPTASVESLEELETPTKQDKPDRITINIQTDKIKRESPKGNLSIKPSDIGVFFMEVLGSILGLAYGAVAQAGQNNAPATL
ncbi:uncharacterized protein LOC109606262 isoform X6 [Aethina tumida]|uniref:uncharacterized protein LOC109606262 isoform X5 n=1 Tax=Aethina tumida TaxID=116153 RepID=UPI00096ADC8A|nr:uncharacterized protein LOC109606262 isoform X5 [Aethina tumida]XP_049824535.1 uncharacterized protein LOC109606262 isoform X1 [Aethina tumida]XP_049824536.1 uncharacterized protein LOC109606262 isoform X2 [Aethina tumida]XP_049824537.1 uncharacterized protein LOC109606262 isoform X3 [Aethina tumida]XP_049824538.1 uncharacterized protein LOC109606262 isoform X4 [Aethina tumida]XP_049824539.1 uncharacterized protein LOC109606262 isoform X6 [Aethina tumida]